MAGEVQGLIADSLRGMGHTASPADGGQGYLGHPGRRCVCSAWLRQCRRLVGRVGGPVHAASHRPTANARRLGHFVPELSAFWPIMVNTASSLLARSRRDAARWFGCCTSLSSGLGAGN